MDKIFGTDEDDKTSDQSKVQSELYKDPTLEDIERLKMKARIAIVDDEEVPYAKSLTNNGYNIHYYSDIDNIDEFLRKRYHVIVLDIQGVGKELSKKHQGFGVLKYIKSECPHVVILVYTGGRFSFAMYREESTLADDFIDKDVDFLEFKLKTDEAIRKAFSPSYHADIREKTLKKEIDNMETYEKVLRIMEKHHPMEKEKIISQLKKTAPNAGNRLVQKVEHYLASMTDIIL
ncbi:MAG: hypothetical protein OXB93_03490 [Cytophagales bacterium]|nr:hypothetical protein [Cytophagales bacterium]